jgi:dihydrolipoamide dehydrogenase
LTGGVGQLLKKAKVKSMIGRAEFLDGKTCLVHMAEGAVRVHAEHIVIATGSEPVEL